MRRPGFPFLERQIPDRLGFLPLLNAFRPADFSPLITRISNRVIGDSEKPTSLFGEAEDVVVNPIFEAKSKWALLS